VELTQSPYSDAATKIVLQAVGSWAKTLRLCIVLTHHDRRRPGCEGRPSTQVRSTIADPAGRRLLHPSFLLGYRLLPRLKNIGAARLYRPADSVDTELGRIYSQQSHI
jgi:TnpA family transposase